MTQPDGPTRRRVLGLLAGSAALVAAGIPLAACSDGDPSDDGEATRPADDGAFWAAIAEAARAEDPSLDAEAARSELGLDLDAAEWAQPTDATRAEVAGRVEADFASGATVLVTGWLLARTEVLLAVVAEDAA